MIETKSPSPSGKYVFQIVAWEARMSLWVETPALIEFASGQSQFDLSNSNWSLDSAEWLDDERVKLSLRRYPGDHSPSSFEVMVNCQTQQATFDGREVIGLDSLEPTLEKLYSRSQTGPSTAAAESTRLTRLAALLIRLLKK